MFCLFENKQTSPCSGLHCWVYNLLYVLIMEHIFRPSVCKLGYFSPRSCGLGWQVLCWVLGLRGCETQHSLWDLERMGFEGEEARGGSRWHFRFQGFVSRSCCGCWVKRRWAAGSRRSQLFLMLIGDVSQLVLYVFKHTLPGFVLMRKSNPWTPQFLLSSLLMFWKPMICGDFWNNELGDNLGILGHYTTR